MRLVAPPSAPRKWLAGIAGNAEIAVGEATAIHRKMCASDHWPVFVEFDV
jgi:hypothetical protein